MKSIVAACVAGLAAGMLAPITTSAQTVATPSPQPTPLRRALPPPLDPIFPSADFLGPTVGTPTDRGVRLYGWANVGEEFSSSRQSTTPMSYNVAPWNPQIDQLVLRIERQPDTVQTEHNDWGFRLSNVYGIDYRFTTAEGYLSNQLLQRNQLNGYDFPEAYGMLYYPHWGKGTVVQVGRYISPPDIEAQLAPQNYLYSHSIMFTFDCYTQTGVLATTKLSDYWSVQYGVHFGDDLAPWDKAAHFPTLEAFAKWTSHSNRDSILAGIDALNDGRFKTYRQGPNLWGHDNLQQSNFTWTHVFSKSMHVTSEAYYLYSKDAYAGGTINNGPFIYGAGGGPGALLPGRSTAVGAVSYFEWKVSPNDFISLRPDYLNDPRGWRSGFATAYGSLTLGLTHRFPNSTFSLRPEYRIEKAYNSNVTPYDNGTRNYQNSFGIDATQWFGNP